MTTMLYSLKQMHGLQVSPLAHHALSILFMRKNSEFPNQLFHGFQMGHISSIGLAVYMRI
jgi:hypothetical protein